MRWGGLACLIAVGCAAGGPRAAAPADRDVLRAGGWTAEAADDCGGYGCLDWLPQPDDDWSLYGYVLDRGTRQPVAGAVVIAVARGGQRAARAATNALGQFHFRELPAGRYDVAILVGGAPRDRWPDVVLDRGRRTALRVHLARAAD